MKVLVVFGTRPEAIKMAPLILKLKSNNNFCTKVCVTGQHREMLDQVLSFFQIIPDYDLDIMKNNQDLYDITSRVLLGVRDVIKKWSPDIILVHGDTTSSMAAALAAYYQCIPVGHVEAGLRTRDIYNPWPEELNRQITARICKWNFSPTINAKNRLIEEAVPESKIYVTGNTIIDALLYVSNSFENDVKKRLYNEEYFKKLLGYDISESQILLVTGHRRENFGVGFINICNAINKLAKSNPNLKIIYPVHLNPNVRKPVQSILGKTKNINLIEPLEYLQFVFLMKHSKIILTDSGGIQEEAPSLGKPVLVMRDVTERPEAVSSGTVRLVGTNYKKIIEEVELLLNNERLYKKMSQRNNPYGDGNASDRIIRILEENQNFKKL